MEGFLSHLGQRDFFHGYTLRNIYSARKQRTDRQTDRQTDNHIKHIKHKYIGLQQPQI